MLPKENRNIYTKGREFLDGRKQKETIEKEDAVPLTVVTESVLITVELDKHKDWELATFDISGAYLHAETDADIIMFLEGALGEIIVKVAPNIFKLCHHEQQGGTSPIC